MANKVKWKYFIISVIISIFVGGVITCFQNKNEFYINLIINTVSISSIPSLFISCMVILNVEDVKKQIQEENKFKSILEAMDSSRKIDFYNSYVSDNGLQIQFERLNKDVDLFLYEKVDNENAIFKRIKNSSRNCCRCISEYLYVEVYIKNLEEKSCIYKKIDEENLTKKEIYLDFTSEDRKDLIELLKEVYNKENYDDKDKEKFDNLLDLLKKYNRICNDLFNKIKSEVQNYSKNEPEEERLDE